MSDITKRIAASLACDAINGDRFERGVCGSQMMEAATNIRTLRNRIAELESYFDLRRAADMRATAQWQEATGREVWPDHADMVVWLLEKMGKLEVDLINWKHWKGMASKAAERLERQRDEARDKALEEAALRIELNGRDMDRTGYPETGVQAGQFARIIRVLKTPPMKTDRYEIGPDGLTTSDHRIAAEFLLGADHFRLESVGWHWWKDACAHEYNYPMTVPLSMVAKHVLVTDEYKGPVFWLSKKSQYLGAPVYRLCRHEGQPNEDQVQASEITLGCEYGQLRELVALCREVPNG